MNMDMLELKITWYVFILILLSTCRIKLTVFGNNLVIKLKKSCSLLHRTTSLEFIINYFIIRSTYFKCKHICDYGIVRLHSGINKSISHGINIFYSLASCHYVLLPYVYLLYHTQGFSAAVIVCPPTTLQLSDYEGWG